MKFEIVDTERAFRDLLAAGDKAARQRIFEERLVEPFRGMIDTLGGGGAAALAGWGMSPDLFAGERGERTAGIVETLAAHDAWRRAERALNRGREAFADRLDQIPLETIVFGLFIADMSGVPSQRGYTGFGGIPGWIMTVYGDPDAYNLERIEAVTVHELHHNVRGTLFPSNPITMTVGEYMILEGLAESFAAELCGPDKIGYWVTDFDESRLEEACRTIGGALDVSGFAAVRGYIFGDTTAKRMGFPAAGVPDFAGYAIGYRIAQAYLAKTGRTVAEATFVPASEIIEKSGFF